MLGGGSSELVMNELDPLNVLCSRCRCVRTENYCLESFAVTNTSEMHRDVVFSRSSIVKHYAFYSSDPLSVRG